MIVVDASAIVELITDDHGLHAVVRDHLLEADDVVGPEHVIIDAASALRGMWLGGISSYEIFRSDLAVLSALEIETRPDVALLPRIHELAHNMTPYDAAYVALAEVLDCPLLTLDRKYARVPNLTIDIREAVTP
ncbi:type II toxin-antitoxin system VapC family toxin [Microbacterium sp.]|uniref:type II toxin-antitoxin system VapC family toxin n=1 Tax=Microbacterium sp. TaxID=51671 RepID=UPI0039E6B2BF